MRDVHLSGLHLSQLRRLEVGLNLVLNERIFRRIVPAIIVVATTTVVVAA
jgi:hypothetical protein